MTEERQMTIADVGAMEVLPPGPPMSRVEARRLVDRINAGFSSLRSDLLALYQGRGWEALDYANWRECVTAEFGQSQTYLYYQLKAAEIERDISSMEEIGSIPERHLRPLQVLPTAEERREAWQSAQAEAGVDKEPMTARKVEAAVVKVATTPYLERLPEEERKVAVSMVFQPGIPAPLAQNMVQKIAEAAPEERKEVLSLYQSEDVRDRNRAMTWAADRVTPADPRLVTFKECIRELRRTIREFPHDPEVPLIERALALLDEAVLSVKRGSNQESDNGTDDN